MLLTITAAGANTIFSYVRIGVMRGVLRIAPPSMTPLSYAPLEPFSVSSVRGARKTATSTITVTFQVLSSLSPAVP